MMAAVYRSSSRRQFLKDKRTDRCLDQRCTRRAVPVWTAADLVDIIL